MIGTAVKQQQNFIYSRLVPGHGIVNFSIDEHILNATRQIANHTFPLYIRGVEKKICTPQEKKGLLKTLKCSFFLIQSNFLEISPKLHGGLVKIVHTGEPTLASINRAREATNPWRTNPNSPSIYFNNADQAHLLAIAKILPQTYLNCLVLNGAFLENWKPRFAMKVLSESITESKLTELSLNYKKILFSDMRSLTNELSKSHLSIL